jgi:hypothetical protein
LDFQQGQSHLGNGVLWGKLALRTKGKELSEALVSERKRAVFAEGKENATPLSVTDFLLRVVLSRLFGLIEEEAQLT